MQLVLARAGLNLDTLLLSPLTRGASQINVYGSVGGEQSVYRPNALTGDPNHLGIMLIVPLLALTPVYLRNRSPWLAGLLGFLLVVELATLSRSGLVGSASGSSCCSAHYRTELLSRAIAIPLAVVAAFVVWIVSRRADFFLEVIRSRIATGDASTSAHFDVYGFIPDVLAAHPLFGLGLNNFSVYYEFATGKDNWGPHSFYVALLVETGLVGTLLFGAFLVWLFRRLRDARPFEPHLAWGLTAALAGTMAANLFYLTMQFYYFYVLAIFALALPVVAAKDKRAGDPERAGDPTRRSRFEAALDRERAGTSQAGVLGCRNSKGSHTSTTKPSSSKRPRSSSARNAVSCGVTCRSLRTGSTFRSAQTCGFAMFGSLNAKRPPGRSSENVWANVASRSTW